MDKGNQAGFTIVEVMLFLAITGLLFLIGFWGTGNQVTSVRFTDSMRSLHSFMQQQYSLVANGANPRDAGVACSVSGTNPPVVGPGGSGPTAGTDADCVLLGRFVKFNPDSTEVNAYYVVGQRQSSSQMSGNDVEDLANARPVLVDQASTNYRIDWQTRFFQPTEADASRQTVAMAFLRSPSSGRIMSFAFPGDAITSSFSPASEQTLGAIIGGRDDIFADNSGYCFEGSGQDRSAMIRLGYDQRADSIELDFNDFNPSTDCVRSL